MSASSERSRARPRRRRGHPAVHARDFDFVAQALAKIERGHERDREDVREMLARGHVTPAALRAAFAAVEPQLYRYPAVDPATFRRALEEALAPEGAPGP